MQLEDILNRIKTGLVIGVDEVGRGPWAGPLVVGAVGFSGVPPPGLADSKVITGEERSRLAGVIQGQAAVCKLGWVWPQEIDELGLTAATTLAIERALADVSEFDHVVIDGVINYLASDNRAVTLVKADSQIPAVSAASIIAKAARDRYMAEQAQVYPEYGFDRHVGYGTARHRRALIEYGATPIHRFSFRPVREIHLLRQEGSVA